MSKVKALLVWRISIFTTSAPWLSQVMSSSLLCFLDSLLSNTIFKPRIFLNSNVLERIWRFVICKEASPHCLPCTCHTAEDESADSPWNYKCQFSLCHCFILYAWFEIGKCIVSFTFLYFATFDSSWLCLTLSFGPSDDLCSERLVIN